MIGSVAPVMGLSKVDGGRGDRSGIGSDFVVKSESKAIRLAKSFGGQEAVRRQDPLVVETQSRKHRWVPNPPGKLAGMWIVGLAPASWALSGGLQTFFIYVISVFSFM
ncbi:hypothetical protein RchiOBHm_Chr2g0120321 [Rosa chinensis]|uniref:Uncharacterized protein n=1 Tax=Rosa chinensis TaxID=74649 RepID=A0A2P6RS87_ROSCH|nr:hypothetical protein RchiOBHm_Chr2g0120321 [Rosa chinensis]